ncbi:MAG: EAL domain-containing protein [Pseudomonadota bacterium]|nr:EAL domain-containing protein [Pseudomonadota bacterium]
MHKLLVRQLKKTFGRDFQLDQASDELHQLLSFISEAYSEYTNERKFLEHTLEQNSQELTAANRLITEKNASLNNQIKAVSHSKAFLNRLIDSVPMFILTLDTEFKIISSNQRFIESTNKNYTDFFSVLPDENARSKFALESRALLANDVEYIHNEVDLLDSFNNTLHIAWIHTMVEDEEGNEIILSIGSDLTERKEAENAMHWLAHNDSLTGIGNRRDFQKNLEHLIYSKSEGALAFIDVNHFKQINDLQGHSVGDQVLVNIADTLKKVTRSNDCISRLAGDEFTVILCRVNEENIEKALDKLVAALNDFVILADGSKLSYTVSVGVALFPQHASDEQNLIIKADLAMYQAKKKGIGRWHLFNPLEDDFSNLHEDSRLIHSLKQAIDDSRMQLYYQPILKLDEKVVSHYEVLLRMVDEQGNLVFPGSFIPAAERMGLIRDVDEWVLGHALQQLALHLKSFPNLKFTVNISAPSLQSNDFPEILKQALFDSGVPSEHLIIELTETAYIDNFEKVLNNLKQVDTLGVDIALDDFGVGFSSFSYLKKMPLTYVKLDGSYVKDLLNVPEDQVFVESVSKMVEAFGMQTIAEFVGDEQTCKRLLELGVSYGQGFFIGQPKPYLATIEEIKQNIS